MIASLPLEFDYDAAVSALAGGLAILAGGIWVGRLSRGATAKLDPQPARAGKVDAANRVEFWKRGLEPALLLYWRRRDAVKGVK